MNGRVWAAVLAVAAASCQCQRTVDDGDAGLDGGTAGDSGGDGDAGAAVADGGAADSGGPRFDAGAPTIDGGGVADASATVDSGVGMVDGSAGFDSGVEVSDAGSQTEFCDGIDNDFDGTIDQLIDGGLLTQACPLQAGVCAGSVARCINGAFVQCDYGSDYQRVEDRCDGIDNDCDGRIDKSWPKILFRADAGSELSGALIWNEVADPRVFPIAGGLMLGFTEQFVWLNQGLEIANQVRFPRHGPYLGVNSVLRDGDGWARVGAEPRGATSSVWYTVHHVDADGGYERNADGTPRLLAEYDSRLFDGPLRTVAALPTDAGWVIAPFFNAYPNDVNRHFIYLDRDGSSSMHTLDASVRDWEEEVVATGSSFFISGPQCHVARCGLDESCVDYQVSEAGLDYCWLATTNPIVVVVGFTPPTRWFDGSGSQLGYGTDYVRRNSYATRTHGVRLTADDGGTTHADFGVISSGEWVNYGRVSSKRQTLGSSVTAQVSRFLPIDERLGLFVFAEGPLPPGGVCPFCAIGDFSAEYICLP